MLSIILRVIAFLLFLLAGFNQTLFSQGELDLIAFGLAALAAASLLEDVGPAMPHLQRKPPPA